MQIEKERGNGSEWLTRRIDRIELELDKMHEDTRRIRDEARIYRESTHADIKKIERTIDELPDITKHYHRQRGIGDATAFIVKVIITGGAIATAIFAIWSVFGDLKP